MENNKELMDYISKSLANGVSKEKIKGDLVGAGWKNEDIDQAFLDIGNSNDDHGPSVSSEEKKKRPLGVTILGWFTVIALILQLFGAAISAFGFVYTSSSLLGFTFIVSFISAIFLGFVAHSLFRLKRWTPKMYLVFLFFSGLIIVIDVAEIAVSSSKDLGLLFLSESFIYSIFYFLISGLIYAYIYSRRQYFVN